MAVSFVPGTILGFQFVGLFQAPLAVLVHVIVAARAVESVHDSSAIITLAITVKIRDSFLIVS